MLAFAILAALMLVGAVAVVTLRQPVHAALALVGTLIALAATYLTLQAHFLAVIQVIVYAGAIMVLFLFVIMLLNVQGQEPPPHLGWMRWAGYALALAVAAGITATAVVTRRPLPTDQQIAAALGGGTAEQLGTALFSHFVLAFQLVGVLLLTGIVGAVSLVQRQGTSGRPGRRTRAGEAPAGLGPTSEPQQEQELIHG